MKRKIFWAVGWMAVGLVGGISLTGWLVWGGRGKPVAAQEVQPPFPPPPGSRFFGAPVGAVPPAAAKHDGISNLEESPELAEFTPEERVHIWVYELCNRSVVHITTKSIREGALLLFAVEIPAEGEGSGVVLDRNGHILTNCHVVEDAQEIQVTLFNGKSYAGRLVGQDRVTDVAVLRIEAPPEELFPVVFGDSNRLRVGQRVYAIGNPFGFERTLTTGIISSLNRTLPSRSRARTIKNVIQIDAAINPGNSGGPLLDTRGRMIGMNTAIASRTGESAGVGFAIPVNTIARVVPQLIEHGRVRRPDVGILRVYQTERGLLVAALTPGGPAEKAGIRGPQVIRQRRRQGPLVYEYTTIDRSAADLIVGVDGQKIKNADDFLSLIESKQPGDVVTLNVLRQGRLVDVPVRLEAGE
jgi:S1-C subfamily serine protease